MLGVQVVQESLAEVQLYCCLYFSGQFKLMSEMFHITHSALHVGLTTTIQHYNKLFRFVSFGLGALDSDSPFCIIFVLFSGVTC